SAKLRGHDAARPNEPGLEYELSSIVNHSSVSFLRTPDIHDEATVDAVRRFDPDVGVCLAAPILKSNIFEIPRLGTINLHKGELPDYRGMPPAFWEIWNGARRVGCSVHQVERALDTGPVLLAATVSVEPFSTVRGLQIKLDQVGVDLIADALEGIANGTAVPKTQVGTGTLHRKPTLAQQAALRVRERKRAPFLWRALAKEIFFALYVRCIRPFPRVTLGLLGRQRVTVLLYHRVSDAIRNSLTVGVEQFEEQMIDVRRRCTVVTIEDIVRGTFSRRSIRPIVAVTFDDGYRDNFEYAAAILLRWRVPAAFFVSTALIDSERGFPHDLVNGGAAIPTMTWKQVKAMKRWGFGIGSHTQTHVNCVKDDPVVVEREIVESKRDLEHRVEQSQCIFAYPYGGREDFNGHWRARVKQAGYIGCLSAYGGCNHAEIEPFNVLRTGISHAFGKWAFRSRLEGWA
ncbi:MAG: polysaccharide deacetylase family protein, partial [bacterium]